MGQHHAQEMKAVLRAANDLECWARTLRDIGNGDFVPPPPPPPPYDHGIKRALEEMQVKSPDEPTMDWLKSYYAETQWRIREALKALQTN